MESKGLVEKAIEAKENAYVPYSGFRVGAALLTDSGKAYTGCNVENASYGAAICAERTAVVKAVSDGETMIKAIAITSDSEDYTFPCGICRQVIAEFCNEETLIICSNKDGKYREYTIDDILPNAFTKKDLL
jgi:cytidine deaminase